MPSGELVANHNRNQCITSTLGWRKFTVNKLLRCRDLRKLQHWLLKELAEATNMNVNIWVVIIWCYSSCYLCASCYCRIPSRITCWASWCCWNWACICCWTWSVACVWAVRVWIKDVSWSGWVTWVVVIGGIGDSGSRCPSQAYPSASSSCVQLRTMCGSRTGGWSLPGVMSDWQRCADWFFAKYCRCRLQLDWCWCRWRTSVKGRRQWGL
jgi:hypothetical protein